jgi:hypothetical protein
MLVRAAPRVWRHAGAITEPAVQRYCLAAQQRELRWRSVLQAGGDDTRPPMGGPCTPIRTELLIPVLNEILLSDMLTRVVAAVFVHRDRLAAHRRALPPPPACRSMAHVVFERHLVTRFQAVDFVLHSRTLSPAEAARWNRLRRRCEPWTDLLLAVLAAADCDVGDYAIDAVRTRHLAHDHELPSPYAPDAPGWLEVGRSLRTAFNSIASPRSPNGDLNGRIAGSVLEWVGGGDSSGAACPLPTAWPDRRRRAWAGDSPHPGVRRRCGFRGAFELRLDLPEEGFAPHSWRQLG